MQTDSDRLIHNAASNFRNTGSLFIKLLRRSTRMSIAQENGMDQVVCSNTTILTMESDGTIHIIETSVSSDLSFVSAKSKFSIDSYNIVTAR